MLSTILGPIISAAQTAGLYVVGLLTVVGVTVWASDSVRKRFFAAGRDIRDRIRAHEKDKRRQAYMRRAERRAERIEFGREWRSRRDL